MSVAHRKPTRNVVGIERVASLLVGAALAVLSAREGTSRRPAVVALGAYLLARAASAQDPIKRALTPRPLARRLAKELGWRAAGVTSRTIAVNRGREEVYAFWRDPARLQSALNNVKSVEVLTDRLSRWSVDAPFGKRASWTAEIVADEPGRKIAWRSKPASDVQSVGEIDFLDSSSGRGSVVRLKMAYEVRGGELSRKVLAILQKEPALQARRDLRRIKQLLETGEVTTARRRRDNRRRELDRPQRAFALGTAAAEARP